MGPKTQTNARKREQPQTNANERKTNEFQPLCTPTFAAAQDVLLAVAMLTVKGLKAEPCLSGLSSDSCPQRGEAYCGYLSGKRRNPNPNFWSGYLRMGWGSYFGMSLETQGNQTS